MSVKDCCSWSLGVLWNDFLLSFFLSFLLSFFKLKEKYLHFPFCVSFYWTVFGNMCISVCGLLPYPCCFMDNLENFYLSYRDVIAFFSFLFLLLFDSFSFLSCILFKDMLSNKMFFPKPWMLLCFYFKNTSGKFQTFKGENILWCKYPPSHRTV